MPARAAAARRCGASSCLQFRQACRARRATAPDRAVARSSARRVRARARCRRHAAAARATARTARRSINVPIAFSRSSTGAAVAQRAMQPAAQLAPAHRRRRLIEHRGERAFGPIGKADVELEIAARRCIQQHGVAALFDAQAAQMRQRRLLRIAHVLQQTSGRAHREADARRNRNRTDRASRTARTAVACRFRDRNARSVVRARSVLSAGELHASGTSSSAGRSRSSSPQRFLAIAFDHAESAARQFEPGETEALRRSRYSAASSVSRRSSRNASSVTVPGVTTRTTWRSTGPFGFRRVADLLADRDRFAAAHQLAPDNSRRCDTARPPWGSAGPPTGRAQSA